MDWKHFVAYWTCCFIGFVVGCFWAGRRRDDADERPENLMHEGYREADRAP